MAKQTEKKEFTWDTQTKIGAYGDAKERHEVFLCTLNGKTYIQDTKEVHTVKNGWKRTKGNTMPLENFKELQHILNMHESGAVEKAGRVTIEAPPKPATGLKAKHQAKESAPTLKGKKSSVREKLERNENFGSLSKEHQEKAVKQVEALHDEYGMVSIGISKNHFFAVWGKSQMDAEKEIKKTKGFSRAQITFIA